MGNHAEEYEYHLPQQFSKPFLLCRLKSCSSIVFEVMFHQPPHVDIYHDGLVSYTIISPHFTFSYDSIPNGRIEVSFSPCCTSLHVIISSAAISSMNLLMFWKSHVWCSLTGADPKRRNAEALLQHGLEVWARCLWLPLRLRPSHVPWKGLLLALHCMWGRFLAAHQVSQVGWPSLWESRNQKAVIHKLKPWKIGHIWTYRNPNFGLEDQISFLSEGTPENLSD